VQCHASVVYAIVVCLSVTSWHSTETAKHRITQTMPHIAPGLLSLSSGAGDLGKTQTGLFPMEAPNVGGVS